MILRKGSQLFDPEINSNATGLQPPSNTLHLLRT
jgi:hypothetical protein